MWGLTLDNVISVNMVLANGTIITATSDHYSDIFWVSASFHAYSLVYTAVSRQ